MLFSVIILVVLLGVASLAVDYGRVELAREQLQNAADAAAMAASSGLSDGTYFAKAQGIASANVCDGSPIALIASDVLTGTWSNGAFTAGGASPNAVQVTAQRSASRNTAISLFFGNLLGASSCDVHASAVAIAGQGGYGFIGLNSISMSGNGKNDSYNSANGSYDATNASNGNLGTNGSISFSGNEKVYGNASYGSTYSASGNSGVVSPGTASKLSTPFSFPNPTLPTSYVDEGSLSASGNGSLNLPSGNYYFTNFSTSGNYSVNVTGQVNIYVNGPVSMSGNFSIANNLPDNLHIYMLSSDSLSISGNSSLYAMIYAPNSAISASGNSDFYGSVLGKSLSFSGNKGLHYDESLRIGSATASLVK